MRTRTCLATVVLSICSMGVPGAMAQPQSQERDPVTDSARRRFQEGVRYFDKGKFEDARASFLQAYALRRHPAVLLNLAQSELRSSHPVEAARHFAAFLREASSASPLERAEAEKALTHLRTKLGRIQPTVNLPGATVLIDGEPVGESPLPEPVDAAVGTHTVEARLVGRVASTTLSVTAGNVATAALNIESPSGGTTSLETPAPPPVPLQTPSAPPPSQETADKPIAPPEPPPPPPNASASATASSEETSGFFGWVRESPVAWISLGLTGAGIATFAIGGIGSIRANDNASAVHDKIEQKAIEWNIKGQNLCAEPIAQQLQNGCDTWRNDIDMRDTDIKVAAVGAVVAGAGIVATIVGYALSSPKKHERSHTGSYVSARTTPWIGPRAAGLTIQGAF